MFLLESWLLCRFEHICYYFPENIISPKEGTISTLTRHKNTFNLPKRKWTKSSPVPLDICLPVSLQLRKLHILKNKSNNFLKKKTPKIVKVMYILPKLNLHSVFNSTVQSYFAWIKASSLSIVQIVWLRINNTTLKGLDLITPHTCHVTLSKSLL